MLRYRTTAAIFPIAVLLAIAVERTATWLVGTFPGEPVVWMISGELRRILRPLSDSLTIFAGGNLTVQAGLIALCMIAVGLTLAIRRWEASALMLNHIALIAFVAVSYLSSGASIAGLSLAGWQLNEVSPFLAAQSSGLHLTMLVIGVAGCIFSHFCFLSNARARHRVVSARIQALSLEMAGRRLRSRNMPLHSR